MNKYLEKIAKTNQAANDETHTRALLRGTRAAGRGWGESLLGTVAGGTLGSALGKSPGGKAARGAIGALVGGTLGGLHGIGRSVQNQAKEISRYDHQD